MRRYLILLSLGVAGVTSAAFSAPSPVTVSTAAAAALVDALPIPLEEITAQADSLGDSLRDQATELAADKSVESINGELKVLSEELNPRLAEVTKMMEPGISLDMLRSQQRTWRQYEKELDDWKDELTTRATLLEQQALSLTKVAATWTATLADANASGAPAELTESSANVLASVRELHGHVESRRRQILGLLVRIAQSDARVDRALGQLRRAREQALNRLFTRDGRPLWAADSYTRAEISAQSQNSLSTQISALSVYVKRRAARFMIHFLILCLLVPLLYFMRRRTANIKSVASSASAPTQVLERPVNDALVLSLLFVPWVYPQAPRLLWAGMGAAALIPAILILRKLFDRRYHALLYAIVAFYFVDQIRSVMAALPVVARMIFAAEMACGACFLGWMVWAGPSARSPQAIVEPSWRRAQIIARGGLVIFLVALATNLLGLVSLSALLGNALLRSAYTAIFLYTIVKMLDAFAYFFLNMGPLGVLTTIRNHRALLARRIHQVLVAGALFLWTTSTLEMLALRAPFFAGLRTALTTPLSMGSINLSLSNIAAFVLTVWAAFLLSRFVRFLLNEDVFPRLQLNHGLPFAISMMLHYLILVTGFLMAIAALGFDMTKFTILAGAFGVGVGFGTQNIINNFVSGLIVLFERPIKLGDVIQIDDATGRVEHIGIRATKIRTGSGSQVIVPNGTLISGRVTNWTGTDGLRTVDISFSVPAASAPQQVIELLKKVALDHPLVSKTPTPEAYFVKVDGASHVFELRLWTAEVGSLGRIKSDLAITFQNALVAPPANQLK